MTRLWLDRKGGRIAFRRSVVSVAVALGVVGALWAVAELVSGWGPSESAMPGPGVRETERASSSGVIVREARVISASTSSTPDRRGANDDARALRSLREHFAKSRNFAVLVQEALAGGSVEAGFFASKAIIYCLQLQAALGADLSTSQVSPRSSDAVESAPRNTHATLQGRMEGEATRCAGLLQIYPDLSLLLRSLRDGRMQSATALPRELFESTYTGTGSADRDLALLLAAAMTQDPFTIDRALSGFLASVERSHGVLVLGANSIPPEGLGNVRLAADILLCELGEYCLPRDLRICQMNQEYCGMPALEVIRRTSSAADWAAFLTVYASLKEAIIDRPDSGSLSWRPG